LRKIISDNWICISGRKPAKTLSLRAIPDYFSSAAHCLHLPQSYSPRWSVNVQKMRPQAALTPT